MNRTDFMNFEDLILEESFREYVIGEPESSRIFWENWIHNHPDKKEDFKKAVNIMQMLLQPRKPDIKTDKYKSWSKILSKIEENNSRSIHSKLLIPSWLKVASVILLSVGLAWLWNWSFNIFNGKDKITFNEIIVPVGEKSQVVLSDGTHVWINSGSHFKYPAHFGKRTREVYLSGEAFFDVTHLEEKMFIVNTHDAQIKVLGTAFNVKAYPEDHKTLTTVVRGLVSMQNIKTDESAVLIKPNQMAFTNTISKPAKLKISNSSQKLQVINRINIEAVTCWKDQHLIFADETFEEIALKMERWFNVSIILEDNSLKKERYNGKFAHNETVYQVLEAIKVTTPIKYTVKNNEIRINRK